MNKMEEETEMISLSLMLKKKRNKKIHGDNNDYSNDNPINAIKVFKLLNSYVDLLIEQMHNIEESSCLNTNVFSNHLYHNNTIYYNELSKCNLDNESLISCRSLLKALNIFNDKIISLQLKLNNNNKYVKEFKRQYKRMNQETKKSFLTMPQINETDVKKLDIAVILSDTNRHTEKIEKHFTNIKKCFNNPTENSHSVLLCKEKEKKEDGIKEAFIENELSRLNKDNIALRLELKFLYEKLRLEDRIYEINKEDRNCINNNDDKTGISKSDLCEYFPYPDICFKLKEKFHEGTWVPLQKYIQRLKETEFYL